MSAEAVTCAALGFSLGWVPSFAEPYLRGYAPHREGGASLAGYRFLAPGFRLARPARPKHGGVSTPVARVFRRSVPSAGFFVGYLLRPGVVPFLHLAPPECVVFCFIEPAGGPLHRRLVCAPGSLLRRTAEYIGWLTHRPPHFEFFPEEAVVLLRRTSMQGWPREKVEHLSRNFFTETLAWMVRSALVRRLSSERIDARLSAGSFVAFPARASARRS